MRLFYFILLFLILLPLPISAEDDREIFLGINTADVREDTSSVQFLNLFSSAIPLSETVPWGSKKEVTYDENGWPDNLNGGQAGTKFLNRLPEDTVEGGFFTVLYDGEGEIFYGNDARLVVHRPNKDIIEIKAGKDKILNASLFIRKSNPENYIRNIRILPEGGVCKGAAHQRVKSPADCLGVEYLSFEDNHLNPWAAEQREQQEKLIKDKLTQEIKAKDILAEKALVKEGDKEKVEEEKDEIKEADEQKNEEKVNKVVSEKDETREDTGKTEKSSDKITKVETKNNDEAVKEEEKSSDVTTVDSTEIKDKAVEEVAKTDVVDKDAFVVKGFSDPKKALLFNPEYLSFMKDFQMVRFMNMSGMTRNPVVDWDKRNSLKKATWGGKYGSRGAPVEMMVALSNHIDAYPWFSMPYKASDDYITKFGEYVKEHLKPELKTYIEYSNEVWNPIFIHHDYAIQQGMKEKLDKKKSQAGYKWFSKRSVQTFKLWEDVFDGNDRLIRVMGGWVSNQILSNTLLAYEDAYKHTDALAIGPYFSALPRVLRRTKTVDEVFKAMLDKKTKEGMESTVGYIKKQVKVTNSFGVDLVAYEGGQHLVDWNTRKVDEHPNPLLYAANRDPRMGILYDELMNEWHRAGGKLFVAFSAPRIYSWYGSWGIKEHIRQARSDAPKYDSLLRYLNARLYPKQLPQPGISAKEMAEMSGEVKNIKIGYAKTPQMIWNMNNQQQIKTGLKNNKPRDIDAHWQANWDTKNLYMSFAINDDDISEGDEITLTLDTTSVAQDLEKEKEQQKLDIANEKALLEKQKKEKALRKIKYERIAREKKEKAEAKKEKIEVKKVDDKQEKNEKKSVNDSKVKKETKNVQNEDKTIDKKETKLEEIKATPQQIAMDKIVAAMKNTESKIDKVKSKEEDKGKTKTKEEKKDKLSSNSENEKDNKTDNNYKTKAKKDTEITDTETVKKDKATETDTENKVDKTKDTKLTESKQSDTKNTEEDVEKTDENATTETGITVQPEPGLQKEFAENVITFTLTPFDAINKHSRITLSDSGYLINVAIPWSEIYYDTDISEIQMKSGDRLGVNIIVKDYDKDEKGNKELISADTSLPLPKLVLKNILFE